MGSYEVGKTHLVKLTGFVGEKMPGQLHALAQYRGLAASAMRKIKR